MLHVGTYHVGLWEVSPTKEIHNQQRILTSTMMGFHRLRCTPLHIHHFRAGNLLKVSGPRVSPLKPNKLSEFTGELHRSFPTRPIDNLVRVAKEHYGLPLVSLVKRYASNYTLVIEQCYTYTYYSSLPPYPPITSHLSFQYAYLHKT